MEILPKEFYEMQLVAGTAENGKVGYRLEPWKSKPTKEDLDRQGQLWEWVFSGVEEEVDRRQANN